MIIAVDFDNTLAVTEYPRIIRPIPELIAFCQARQAAGDTLILNTCRHDDHLRAAVDWCAAQGLVFNFVNANHPDMIELYGDTRKIYADMYIDDKNLLIKDVIHSVLSADDRYIDTAI